MGILNEFAGWVYISLGAIYAIRGLYKVLRASRVGARSGVILDAVVVGLGGTVLWVLLGVELLLRHSPYRTWLVRGSVVLGSAAVLSLVAAWIVSRRRAGVSWWRFWVRVIPPPATGSADLSDDNLCLSTADMPEQRSPIMLDVSTVNLLERIEGARFSTVRLCSGYDEEQVDAFLDKLLAVLRDGGQLDQAVVRDVMFSATRLRPGYAMRDVDDLLDEIVLAAAP
jgi:DivIVA domain-containing protein